MLITLGLVEATARLMTQTAPNGLPAFRGVALLPLRPDAAQVREALARFHEDALLMPDPELGWNVRPGRRSGGDHTNAQGLRADPGHLYPLEPPPGKLRIATVGDSFVYCMEVANGETWQDYLEALRPDLEVLNLGLPAAGTDQAFLRWRRDARPFGADIAILGIWPDDIFRNLNVVEYYRTRQGLGLSKPRLVREGGEARFVNLPVLGDEELVATLTHPEAQPLLRYEYWYDPAEVAPAAYRRMRIVQVAEGIWRRYLRKRTYQRLYSGEIADGIEVTVAIAKLFAEEARKAGSLPLVLLIPDRTRLEMHTGARPFPLVQELHEAGIDVIDLGPTFGAEVLREGGAAYYVGGVGHHTPFANRVFAAHLERELRPWIDRAWAARATRSPARG